MGLGSLLFIVANQCSCCLVYALKLVVKISYYFQLTNLIVITIIWKL